MLNNTRHVILTGGSSGIGYEAAKALAQDPSTVVVVASRTPPKDLPSNVEFHAIDLSDLDSVREFAAWYPYSNVDVFIACAGIAGSSPVKYVDKGVEEVFATNHLGHALLFFLLNSRGLLVPDARIAIVGSSLHNPENKSRMKPSWTTADAVAHASDPEMQAAGITYPNSKLANTLFAYALTRRASAAGRKWAVNIYDPGFVPGGGSKLHRNAGAVVGVLMDYVMPHLTFLLRWKGAVTSTAPESGGALADLVTGPEYSHTSGKMVRIRDEMQPGENALVETTQDDLWDWTVKFLDLTPEQIKL